MSATSIEWTQRSWNPIVGCTIVSPGCTNCYAMRMAARIDKMTLRSHYAGLTQSSKGGPVWTGKLAWAQDDIWHAPLRRQVPTTYFVNSMGDLFHEDCPDELIDRVFAIMALAGGRLRAGQIERLHTFQILTKRAERMRAYMAHVEREARWMNAVADLFETHPWTMDGCYPIMGQREPWLPLPNVWLGVSAEDQARADERIPLLLQTPAAVRFVSLEPLLGPITLWGDNGEGMVRGPGVKISGGVTPGTPDNPPEGYDDSQPWLDWVIVGGESGPNARLMQQWWARSLLDQCAAADVPFFMKQMTKKAPIPDDLMVRQFPAEVRS